MARNVGLWHRMVTIYSRCLFVNCSSGMMICLTCVCVCVCVWWWRGYLPRIHYIYINKELVNYLWRLLGPFSLPCAQKWPWNINHHHCYNYINIYQVVHVSAPNVYFNHWLTVMSRCMYPKNKLYIYRHKFVPPCCAEVVVPRSMVTCSVSCYDVYIRVLYDEKERGWHTKYIPTVGKSTVLSLKGYDLFNARMWLFAL